MLKVPCVAAILANDTGHILLLQRDDRPDLEFAGWWTLPGGRVEDGEQPDEAIQREVYEEVAVRPALRFWLAYERAHHRRIAGQTVIVVQYVYTGSLTAGLADLSLNEGQALGFFGPDDLDRLAIAYGFDTLLGDYFRSATCLGRAVP